MSDPRDPAQIRQSIIELLSQGRSVAYIMAVMCVTRRTVVDIRLDRLLSRFD